jgi:dephospho-CoA kinase
MTRPLRIGLTGGIASGKSSVSARFRELGVSVIDADESARRVVAPGTPGLAAVLREFGPDLLDADGNLDRRRLRTLVFSDPDKRRSLESILHPLIHADMEREATLATGPYLIMVIPLLVEGASRNRVDRILVVDVPEPLQLERLQARDGASLDQARAMLGAQATRENRLQAADDMLQNVGTFAELRGRVDALHQRYLQLAAVKP